MSAQQSVSVRPNRAARRAPIVPVARGRYFDTGGFTVNGEQVRVQARSGRISEVPRNQVSAVVLTHGPRTDLRVLLTTPEGATLSQDTAFFYGDDDLRRLASAIGCPFVEDPRRSFADLERAHPGTLRYRWERHPAITGLLIGLVICLVIFAIALIIS